MHARATTVQVQPGKMQEAIDIFKDSVVPAAKAQKGFQGFYLMTDASSGKGLAISVWETEADMVAVESSGAYQEQLARFGNVFAGAPTTDHYELSVEAGP
ncbi:MAG: antibiotic biosynthesis monooxygenase [Chloroflexi bacterium]|nr:antibiotic biosynthesis monooxygenase [Chloroflexota bacterium]